MDGGGDSGFAHRCAGGGGDPMEEPASVATEEADVMFARRGCCCFWLPRFGTGRSAAVAGWGWGIRERICGRAGDANAPAEAAFSEEPWWRQALMKVREWSEILAGPRWKTFIRRFNRNHRFGGGGVSGGGWCGTGGGFGRLGKFQYDPLSYALNFDEGLGQDGDVDEGHRNFSTRYVLPPSLVTTSMDLGGRDAPPLFAAA